MSNNSFNILNYIKNRLMQTEKTTDKVIVCMNVDSNNEPYIEMTYIDCDGNIAGLTKNYESLVDFAGYCEYYEDIFDAYLNDRVMSVVYDVDESKLNLIKYSNGNYVGHKFYEDYSNLIFVGYVIKKSNLSYEEKVKTLYKVMKQIMEAAYRSDYEGDFIFKVKDEIISNIYTVKDFKEGIYQNENIETTDQGNISIIESTLEIKLREENNQKILK